MKNYNVIWCYTPDGKWGEITREEFDILKISGPESGTQVHFCVKKQIARWVVPPHLAWRADMNHRTDGPAVLVFRTGDVSETWAINGRRMGEEDFKTALWIESLWFLRRWLAKFKYWMDSD